MSQQGLQTIASKYNNAMLGTISENVCTLQMNRPKKLNALNPDLVRGLLAMLQFCVTAKDIHIVILTGGM